MRNSGEDVQLLLAVGKKDRQAFEELYRKWKDKLFHYALFRIGNREAAEEVLQDIFLALWRSAGGYGQKASPYTWIFSLARNKIADYFRDKKRREKLEDTAKSELGRESFATEDFKEANIDLFRALKELDQVSREAIILIFYQGLSYKEAGETMDIPEGTVKSRVFYARKKLAARLKKGGGY